MGTAGGVNNFDVYTGGVSRNITDLVVEGGVGGEALSFGRLTTSRYLGAVPTPLGTAGSWRYSYLWNIYYAGANSNGTEIIAVDYPDGNNWRFDKKSPSDLYLTAVSETQDCVKQDVNNPALYNLYFSDGKRLQFVRTGSGSGSTYQAQGFYDKFGLYYSFNLDQKGRVTKVTEPAGRWINITYGPVGNFGVGTVVFSYSNASASSVYITGDFNNWSTTANPMVKDAQGKWTTTVPLQLGTWQYKFVVDGNWTPDPTNPDHIPAGANNNSAVTVINKDQGTTTSQPTPVTFSYTNASATSVSVAGDFNNWSATANVMNLSGGKWVTSVNIPNGAHLYKFVINGGSQWINDPSNPFTAPDGYGSYNSKLAVGPYDEAITQVQTSDGRSVVYNYIASSSFGAIYSALTQVNYGDGTSAHYTYTTPFTNGGRPILASADDPRYKGKATRIAYTYQNTGVDGFIYQEKSLATGSVLVTLNAPNESIRSLTNANGGVEQFSFNNLQLTSRTNGVGGSVSATYDAGGFGMVSSFTDGNNNAATITRTPYFGAITKITHADNSFEATTYTDVNKPFFPATITNEIGAVTTYTRDSNGRPNQITYNDSSYETFTYNSFGQVLAHRLRNGGVESSSYDSRGLKTSLTDAANNVWVYTYDSMDRMVAVSDPLNHTKSLSYNDRGDILSVTYHNGAHIDYIYDNYGNRVSRTNELGKKWAYAYDEYNRVVTETDPLNQVTTTTYGNGLNSNGCSSCSTEPKPASITTPSGKRLVMTYDSAWRMTSKTYGDGTVDAASTSFGYDAAGNLISLVNARGKTWLYTYDNRNRRATSKDPSNNVTKFAYDANGNKLSETRPDNKASTYTYDSMDRLIESVDALGNVTKQTYDAAGNVTSVTDPNNNIYGSTYDNLRRIATMTYPGSSTEGWTYDGVGNVQTYTNRLGKVKTFTYDSRNRETNNAWNDGSTPGVTKSYDVASHILTLNNANSLITYTYDDCGRIKSETQNVTGGPGAMTVAYNYDVDGNRSAMTYPDASVLQYSYTNRNQVSSMIFGGLPILANYFYDLTGNRTGKTLENGISTSYAYDDSSRLISVVHQKNANVIASFNYAYDNLNRKKSVVRADGLGDVFGYDAAGEITSVQYNAQNPTTSPSNAQTVAAYTYDPDGNRLTATMGSASTTYSPNSLNQYTQVGGLSLSYDGNGNLNSPNANTSPWLYDSENRLSIAYFNQSQGRFSVLDVAYTIYYDGRNRPVKRVINGNPTKTTCLIYDGWHLIGEYTNSSQVADYVHGSDIDETLMRVGSAGDAFYHQDAIGSVTHLTDSSGSIVEQYKYDVYGQPSIANGTGNSIANSAYGNRFMFTGREYLGELKSYDYRTRVYSTLLGRFLQTDSLRFAGGDVNLYRYVNNDPTNHIDPSGQKCYSAKDIPSGVPIPPSFKDKLGKPICPGTPCYVGALIGDGVILGLCVTCSF